MKFQKVKVGDFLIRVKDLVPIVDSEEYSLVTIKLYHKGVHLRKKVKGTEIQAEKMSKVKAGQFILSGIDARNGAFGIIPPELDGAVVTNDFWHFDIDELIVSKEYFLWLTSTPYFDDICNKASDGTTNRIRLQADRFYKQELYIPDIDNQHVVVEELKKQSSKFDFLKNEYSHQLTLLSNLNQAILQEAVQGKLVEQDPNDEPASELLTRIKAEKMNRVGLKPNSKSPALKGRAINNEAPIKPEEIPFEIPESWVWCRLIDVISILGDGLHGTPNYDPTGEYYFINGNNLINGKIEMKDTTKRVSESEYLKHRKPLIHNTVFVSINGTLGNLAYYNGEKIILGKSACYFNLHQDISREYIGIFIKSSYFLKYAVDVASETTIKNVSLKSMRILPIPLPPLSEQKRIVVEIEKQLSKTNQLKEHIIANQQATEQLLKALLHQAFEVETV